MIVVEETQFSEKVIRATTIVGAELSEYKGNMLSQQGGILYPWKQDQPTLEMLRPSTVASRFTLHSYLIRSGEHLLLAGWRRSVLNLL